MLGNEIHILYIYIFLQDLIDRGYGYDVYDSFVDDSEFVSLQNMHVHLHSSMCAYVYHSPVPCSQFRVSDMGVSSGCKTGYHAHVVE